MEHSQETEKLLKQFIEETAKTLASHKASLELHQKSIMNNRETIEGLAALVNLHSRAFNVMRHIVIRLFEDRFGSEGIEIPDVPVN